ncbi:MAG: hypothetical protein FWG50_01520 [Kiritimatiellaeota bacterium]|nr:hypothetical protein [Kiritimatiellota bacterium]
MDDLRDSWRGEVAAFLRAASDKPPAGGGVSPELLLFQIEGGEDFVAQAHSASDLWSGACLLSRLMARAIRAVADEMGAEAVVFPCVKGDALDAPRQGVAALPDRFVAVVPEGRGQELAQRAQAALRAELAAVGETVYQDGWDRALWDAQVKRFPRTVWVTYAWRAQNGWLENYAALEMKLAARRNTYDFDAWPSKGNEYKDAFSGAEEALAELDGMPCGAMSLIKRNWWRKELGERRFRNYGAYYGVLTMAGDWLPEMGRAQKALSPATYLARGEALARFAAGARQVVERFGGDLLRAGGEVLAVVPGRDAVRCAQLLRDAFRKETGGEVVCGIAIGYRGLPFQTMLRDACRMREVARERHGGAGMSLVIYRRAGQVIEWGCAWASVALELMEAAMVLSGAQKLSNRFTYALAQCLQPYGLGSPIFSGPVILAEFARVVSRQGKGVGDALLNLAMQYLHDLSKGTVGDFLNLFMVGTFLNRTSGGRSE